MHGYADDQAGYAEASGERVGRVSRARGRLASVRRWRCFHLATFSATRFGRGDHERRSGILRLFARRGELVDST